MKSHRFLFPSLFVTTLLAASCAAQANVRLPHIFGDHMVLQRESTIPVWGWADPGEKVTVSAGIKSASTITGADGKWKVQLGRVIDSGKPIEMTVVGKNSIILHDVLLGDVWVCAGQSNMELGFLGDGSFREESKKADQPQIRLFVVPKIVAPQPAEEIGTDETTYLWGSWQVCNLDTLSRTGPWKGFTAVGYYFGKDIQQSTGKPVGLIQASWGGTCIQSWTSLEGLKAFPEGKKYAAFTEGFRANFQRQVDAFGPAIEKYKVIREKWDQEQAATLTQWDAAAKQVTAEGKPVPPKPVTPGPPYRPVAPNKGPDAATSIYNGMIAPLIPYAIKGAIWYQGENNSEQPVEYRMLFPAMIADWRSHWNQGDFPFLFVQLPNNGPSKPEPDESNWAMLREAQLKTLSCPNTGMAVTIDIGEVPNNIHPRDKWDVGERLALAARHVAYGEKIPYSGPIYKGMKVEGSKIRIQFDHAAGGLAIGVQPPHIFPPRRSREAAAEVQGFSIAGADGKFVWAQTCIDGETVLVSSDAVPTPVAVRYAWAGNPVANLYNKAGLPASPFRTDTDAPKAP